MSRRQKLLCWWLLLCALPLGSISAINTIVDVSGVIRGHNRAAMARYAADVEKAPYGVAYAPRERAIKLALLNSFPAECYAVGSSHINGVSPKTLPKYLGSCASFLNLWVAGGALDDLLVFARHIGETPGVRTVVIGLDWWFFHADNLDLWLDQSSEITIARAFYKTLDSRGAPASESTWESLPRRTAETLRYLVNGNYLVANLHDVAAHGAHWTLDQEAVPVSPEFNSLPVLHADGNATYSAAQLAMPATSFECNNGRFGDGLAARQEGLFLNAVAWLKGRNIQVVLVITPIHEALTQCPSVVWNSRFETYVRQIGAQLGVPVIGGLDPRPFGITASEIGVDGMHPLPSAFAKLRELPPKP